MNIRINPSRVFVLLCLGFFCGLALGSNYGLVEISGVSMSLVAATLVAAGSLFAVKKYWRGVLVCVCLLSVVGGAKYIQIALLEPNQFSSILGTKLGLIGMVTAEPDVRTTTQLVLMRPEGYSQLVQITLTPYREILYGDRLRLTGKIVAPENFSDFDYVSFLEARNVTAVMKYPKVQVLDFNQGNLFKKLAIHVQRHFVSEFSKWLPKNHADLASGMVLGAGRLSEQERDKFRATGLSHLVVASGYNISVVAGISGGLVYVLGRRRTFVLTILFVTFYCLMAGLGASVLRAAFMGILVALAPVLGRPYSPGPALSLAALVLLLFQPMLLKWDIGFQLSFVATMGILYGVPIFFVQTKFPQNFFTNAVAVSFTAFFATLPLIMHQFGQLSVVALLANVIVAPLVPFIMLFGAAIIVPAVGPGAALIAEGLLSLVLFVADFFASLPWSVQAVGLGSVETFLVYIMYIFVVCLLYPKAQKSQGKLLASRF